MTNTIAISLCTIILAAFAVDWLVLGYDLHLIVMRSLLDLINWLAFWR